MLDTTLKTAALLSDIELVAVCGEQRIEGNPQTGFAALGRFNGTEVGVWEMTPGVMRDVETDEVFVVLTGLGTVEFEQTGQTVKLEVGDVVRLRKGQQTVWTITETMRKVYFA